MALIKCPECGHDVSDRASACPHCGCPVEIKQNNCLPSETIPTETLNEIYECNYCGYKTRNLNGSYLCPVCKHVLSPTSMQKRAVAIRRRNTLIAIAIVFAILVIGWCNRDWINNTIQSNSANYEYGDRANTFDTSVAEYYTWISRDNYGITITGLSSAGRAASCITSMPSRINGQPVTQIADYAFSDCNNLALTSLPKTITSIGKSAFANCSNVNIMYVPCQYYNQSFYGTKCPYPTIK